MEELENLSTVGTNQRFEPDNLNTFGAISFLRALKNTETQSENTETEKPIKKQLKVSLKSFDISNLNFE